MDVEVLSGPGAAQVVRLLSGFGAGLVHVTEVSRPGAPALVVGTRPDPAADAVVAPDGPAVRRLWARRVEPFARWWAGLRHAPPGPPVLHDHDPALPLAARRLLDRLRAGLREHDDGWSYDHIGSTAVPGLRAKPLVDLQVGVSALPAGGSAVDAVLARAGFRPPTGVRPDAPGVHRDYERQPGLAPPGAYRKRLYVRADPACPAILHVRLLGAPWWADTVRFRDLLRADPDVRRAYQELKERSAREHGGGQDYDDYTRSKSAFFADLP
ncbi:GrpB family protein [Actinosynnema sp. NPDC050436]|uniref:GrpB family protein n=1 Tax=Actinosynnema sp. NPDC050436 TaxID=3155659 RepID=UPI0033E4A889